MKIRARILSRYLTLPRPIERAGYKRIVIVAHSQGMVIIADLLRLLNAGQ
jgi:esterase/lipase superfamily enzyme